MSIPELSPLIYGLTVKDMWPITFLEMPFWLLLALAPRWRYTHMICLISPLIHAVVYFVTIAVVLMNADDPPDFFTFEGVYAAFRDPNVVFIGWIHYLAFDLLVGLSISKDAIERGASNIFYYVAVVPCLYFTMMLGPVGFLGYAILRTIFLSGTGTKETNEKKSS